MTASLLIYVSDVEITLLVVFIGNGKIINSN